MLIPTSLLNTLLAQGTILLQLFSIGLLILFFRERIGETHVGNFLRRYGLFLAFLTALAGVVLSLYYSEVVGYPPCGLCWLQRVFLYPQAVLLAYAAWKRDGGIAPYIILLSVFGGIIALYQHTLQMGWVLDALPCPAAPELADCAQRLVFEYGYITIPLMSFTSFVFIALVMLFARKRTAETRAYIETGTL